ncbi:MAG: alginate export family protein [Nitrospirota bacterium]|nr:alginate export family protein [Nitrospirota bacterium]
MRGQRAVIYADRPQPNVGRHANTGQGETPVMQQTRPGTARYHTGHGVSALLCAGLLSCLLGAPGSSLAAASTPAEGADVAGPGSGPSLDLRYRYEFLQDALYLKDAHASTLRARLGYRSKPVVGTRATIEIEGVGVAGADQYRNTVDPNPGYPFIPDPPDYAVNQAYLAFTTPVGISMNIGRQRLAFDNERHIGPDMWRQKERTFDSLRVESRLLEEVNFETLVSDIHFTYAYVMKVGQNDFEERSLEAHLMNLSFAMWPSQRTHISFYGYFVDDNEPHNIHDLTSSTIGWYYERLYRPEMGKVKIILEYAKQDTYQGRNGYLADPGFLNKDTYHTNAAVNIRWPKGLSAEAGYQVFTSQSRIYMDSLGNISTLWYGFQTPLGSNHAFNGWSDLIVPGLVDWQYTTPKYGLKDLSLGLSGPLWGLGWQATYHSFQQFDGSPFGNDYGTEVDALLSRDLTKTSRMGIMLAQYSAANLATSDVTRAALYFEISY